MDQQALDSGSAHKILSGWKKIDRVLRIGKPIKIHVTSVEGVGEIGKGIVITSDGPLPLDISDLAKDRARARLAKDFRKSDELRDKLNALGWEARDTKDGQKITRRAGA